MRTETEVDRDGAVDVEALYEAHWTSMLRLAVLLVDDVGSAEDVVQEAFIGLHRNASRIRDPQAALGYVRAAVVNRARSALRHRGVVRRHLRAAEPDVGPPSSDAVLLAEEHREVLAALHGLPRRQREVLVLRYWSDRSEAEIADLLSISRGSVKSAASRGIASLRLHLGGAL
ncbi:MAG: SigE family RNA polymerase sigma factor [Micrococcales bacterium]|uniref:SigE family RNA polymerase sigma factor n=1 Tax=Phycicoccus sp. TaxID=1902410 RepID=UPI0019A99874|nr:SigE family RNA polymerase sigma factor [Phycicoccus sp.]MBD3785138.1 SigE family RNA polymerase sigma factor [Micrococcales bacterium]HMM94364.1 SigE family RNA polymerase sigma factor [Phycicoccus sp.]